MKLDDEIDDNDSAGGGWIMSSSKGVVSKGSRQMEVRRKREINGQRVFILCAKRAPTDVHIHTRVTTGTATLDKLVYNLLKINL